MQTELTYNSSKIFEKCLCLAAWFFTSKWLLPVTVAMASVCCINGGSRYSQKFALKHNIAVDYSI